MAAILGLSADLINDICAQVSDDLTPLPNANITSPAAQAFSPNSAVVSPANLNSPNQTVISGAADAVHRVADLCKQAGAKRAVMLAVSAPFHCALMEPAQKALATDLEALVFNDPQFPVAANVDARLITRRAEARDCLIRQVTAPVRWVECIQLLAAQDVTRFIEVGPGKVLTGLMRQILDKSDSGRITLNVEDTASLERSIEALAAS
jgi:[acyl-carrier-protein] S-malonyltransferase